MLALWDRYSSNTDVWDCEGWSKHCNSFRDVSDIDWWIFRTLEKNSSMTSKDAWHCWSLWDVQDINWWIFRTLESSTVCFQRFHHIERWRVLNSKPSRSQKNLLFQFFRFSCDEIISKKTFQNGFPFFLVSYQEKNFPGTIEWAGKEKHHDFRLKRFRLLCPSGSFGSEKIPCNFCQRKLSHLQRGTSKKFQSKHHFWGFSMIYSI